MANKAGRVLLIPRGNYNPNTEYHMLDFVKFQGNSYVAKGTTLGNLPTDTDYWQAMTEVEYGYVTPEMFGAVGDGITDDSEAFQTAINSGAKIQLLGKTYVVNININVNNVSIVGDGTLKGTVTINADHIKIADISMQSSTNCFVLSSGKYITFDNINITSCDSCFYVPTPAEHQPISRVIISNSLLRGNYGFNCADGEYEYFSIGDLQIINTQFYSDIYGINAKQIDGLILDGCTMFFPSHSTQDMNKKCNIKILGSNYIIITACNLFEAGRESIYLSDVRGVVISGNNIVWCGQNYPSSGILIDGIKASSYLASVNVTGNNIQYPTDDAIVIANVNNDDYYLININNNNILGLLRDNFYYGTEPIKTTDAYIVKSSATNKEKVSISNNIGMGGKTTQIDQVTAIVIATTDITNGLIVKGDAKYIKLTGSNGEISKILVSENNTFIPAYFDLYIMSYGSNNVLKQTSDGNIKIPSDITLPVNKLLHLVYLDSQGWRVVE